MSILYSRYSSDSGATVHFAKGLQCVPHIFPQSEQLVSYRNIHIHPENSFLDLSCLGLSDFYRKQMNFQAVLNSGWLWLLLNRMWREWFPVVKRHCGLFRPRLIQFNASFTPVSFSGSWKENTFPNQFRDTLITTLNWFGIWTVTIRNGDLKAHVSY